MVIALTIIGILIFFGGAYFMGNFILGTFDEDIIERIMSSFIGVLCWLIICAIFIICSFIYLAVINLIG